MVLPVGSSVGAPYHLPGVVDRGSDTIVSTKRAEIGYFLAVKVNEKSVLLGEHGRCEPDTQDCRQDKVAQGAAVVNVHQILKKDQEKVDQGVFDIPV
jgi:hypothetical protein